MIHKPASTRKEPGPGRGHRCSLQPVELEPSEDIQLATLRRSTGALRGGLGLAALNHGKTDDRRW